MIGTTTVVPLLTWIGSESGYALKSIAIELGVLFDAEVNCCQTLMPTSIAAKEPSVTMITLLVVGFTIYHVYFGEHQFALLTKNYHCCKPSLKSLPYLIADNLRDYLDVLPNILGILAQVQGVSSRCR